MAPRTVGVPSVHGDTESSIQRGLHRGKLKVISEVTSIELQSTINQPLRLDRNGKDVPYEPVGPEGRKKGLQVRLKIDR